MTTTPKATTVAELRAHARSMGLTTTNLRRAELVALIEAEGKRRERAEAEQLIKQLSETDSIRRAHAIATDDVGTDEELHAYLSTLAHDALPALTTLRLNYSVRPNLDQMTPVQRLATVRSLAKWSSGIMQGGLIPIDTEGDERGNPRRDDPAVPYLMVAHVPTDDPAFSERAGMTHGPCAAMIYAPGRRIVRPIDVAKARTFGKVLQAGTWTVSPFQVAHVEGIRFLSVPMAEHLIDQVTEELTVALASSPTAQAAAAARDEERTASDAAALRLARGF